MKSYLHCGTQHCVPGMFKYYHKLAIPFAVFCNQNILHTENSSWPRLDAYKTHVISGAL